MKQHDLFESSPVVHAPPKARKRRPSLGWEFTDHACHNCFGRVMRRENLDGTIVARCAECGASAVGQPQSLCWCGVEVRGHGTVFECLRNPGPTVSTPQEVLVREKKIERVPPKPIGANRSVWK